MLIGRVAFLASTRIILKKDLKDIECAYEDWKKAAELGDENSAKLVEEHCQ